MFRWWQRGLNGGPEVADTAVKRLICGRFPRTVEVIGQVYQCWWRICQEIIFFPRLVYHMLHVLYQFVACLLTFPHTSTNPISSHHYMSVSWLQQWNFLSEDMRISIFGKKNQKLFAFCGTWTWWTNGKYYLNSELKSDGYLLFFL
jgi:hypothetical protein